MLRVGVGHREGVDTAQVLAAAIADVREQLGGTPAAAAVVTISGNFDPQQIASGLAAAFPAIPIVGVTSAGDLSSRLGVSEDSINLLVLACERGDAIRFSAGLGERASEDPDAAAAAAIAQAAPGPDASLCFAFPDSRRPGTQALLTALAARLPRGCAMFGGKLSGQFDDIEARNAWRADVLTGRASAGEFMANLLKISRDHARTPMQWDEGPNGGFTTGRPWLPVNPNTDRINARQALSDPGSIYHYYARLIALRRAALPLVYGDYKDLDPDHPTVFAYTRTLGLEGNLVVLNVSREVVPYRLAGGIEPGRMLLGNLDDGGDSGATLTLRPWEARLYRL